MSIKNRIKSFFIKNEKLDERAHLFGFLIGVLLGFLLRYYKLELSDFITVIFTVILMYFSWIQTRHGKLQYDLAMERSAPSLISTIDPSSNRFFHIRNNGERSAFQIECMVYNQTLDERHPFETIDELYSNSMIRLYFPEDWWATTSIINIEISYECDEEKGDIRRYSDEILLSVEN